MDAVTCQKPDRQGGPLASDTSPGLTRIPQIRINLFSPRNPRLSAANFYRELPSLTVGLPTLHIQEILKDNSSVTVLVIK